MFHVVDEDNQRVTPLDVRRQAVPADLVDDLLRLLHLDWLTRRTIPEDWPWNSAWFPHLAWSPQVMAIADALPEQWRKGVMATPQILLHFPDPQSRKLSFHVDSGLPDGYEYTSIVGVALSAAGEREGALHVHSSVIDVQPGDAVCLASDTEHSSGINQSGTIRYVLYLRWMRQAGEERQAA